MVTLRWFALYFVSPLFHLNRFPLPYPYQTCLPVAVNNMNPSLQLGEEGINSVLMTLEAIRNRALSTFFPELFLKYHREVYPARIVFVSFLENPSEKGRMVKALENMGIEPILFRLDSNRPDLQKLDSLLGMSVVWCGVG